MGNDNDDIIVSVSIKKKRKKKTIVNVKWFDKNNVNINADIYRN